MPGRLLGRVMCDVCGAHVQDMREVIQGTSVLCRPCAEGAYYPSRRDRRVVRYAEKE